MYGKWQKCPNFSTKTWISRKIFYRIFSIVSMCQIYAHGLVFRKKQGGTGLDLEILSNFLNNLRHIGEKCHSPNLRSWKIILRLFSAIGSKGTFNELKISYPTVYDMNRFDNLHFRHFRRFLCAEACAVQECQTSLSQNTDCMKI